MADIPLGIGGGGTEPPLSASGASLPADVLTRLKSGEMLTARVIRPAGQGRFLLNIAGTQVTVESRLVLSSGDQLSLAAREAGSRLLLDIVRSSGSGSSPAGTATAQPAAPGNGTAKAPSAPQGSAAPRSPAHAPAPAGQQTAPPADAAARTIQVEAQALLSRSAPLGEIVREVRRLLTEAPSRQKGPSESGDAQPSTRGKPGAGPPARPMQTAERPAPESNAAAGQAAPRAAPETDQTSHPVPPAGDARQAQARPLQPVEPIVSPGREVAPDSAHPSRGTSVPRSTAAPESRAPATSSPAPTGEAAEAPQPAAGAAVSREVLDLLRSLVLFLPGASESEPAEPPAPQQLTPAQPPHESPPALPATAPDNLPVELRELVQATPARIEQLIALLEARANAILSSLPEAAKLDVLIETLERLPSPPASAPPAEAPSNIEQAIESAAPRETTSALVERLLAALEFSRPRPEGPDRPALPPEVQAELERLEAPARAELGQLLHARERALIDSSPQLRNLGRAHRALQDAALRLQAGRAASLATSQPGASFSYAEVPTFDAGEGGTARLRVMLKRDGGGAAGTRAGAGGAGGAGGSGKAGGPLRAVLDLELSGLGEVWSELLLSGEDLAVRLELPDAARRDLVASEIPALEERLEARGFRATATAEARPPDGPALAPELWPDAADPGGLDIWA